MRVAGSWSEAFQPRNYKEVQACISLLVARNLYVCLSYCNYCLSTWVTAVCSQRYIRYSLAKLLVRIITQLHKQHFSSHLPHWTSGIKLLPRMAEQNYLFQYNKTADEWCESTPEKGDQWGGRGAPS